MEPVLEPVRPRHVPTHQGRIIQDPPLARFLFSDTRAGWIWLPLRIWLGIQWLEASLSKLGNPAWVQTGVALKGFWTTAVAEPAQGKPPIAFDWYRDFLNFLLQSESYVWFAKVIAVGELLIGIGLIIGAFVGIAAFFGAFMNWNFIMAGSASSNGLLLALAIVLVLAWKVAGYMGADRFLLRRLGVPWENPTVAPSETTQSHSTATAKKQESY